MIIKQQVVQAAGWGHGHPLASIMIRLALCARYNAKLAATLPLAPCVHLVISLMENNASLIVKDHVVPVHKIHQLLVHPALKDIFLIKIPVYQTYAAIALPVMFAPKVMP